MSVGTALQPTYRCPLCLAELQLTICSFYSTLLRPVVQHCNQLLNALYGIISGETTTDNLLCSTLSGGIRLTTEYLLRSILSGGTTADSLSGSTLIINVRYDPLYSVLLSTMSASLYCI
jgi:hypothetical protein